MQQRPLVRLSLGSKWDSSQRAADLKADHLPNVDAVTVQSSLQRATIGRTLISISQCNVRSVLTFSSELREHVVSNLTIQSRCSPVFCGLTVSRMISSDWYNCVQHDLVYTTNYYTYYDSPICMRGTLIFCFRLFSLWVIRLSANGHETSSHDTGLILLT